MWIIVVIAVAALAGWRIRVARKGYHFLGGPACPRCRARMFKQTGSRYGARVFWSCRRWPRCNGTRELNWDHTRRKSI
jgi:ssDNA-binding Zn-finger/Zn-ribbon topoisomerase 1